MKIRQLTQNYINILFPLSLILVLTRSFPAFSFLYYAAIPLFIMFIITSLEIYTDKNYIKIIFPAAAFTVWCLITSLWSPYPQTTIIRSVYFFFIFISALSVTHLWKKKYNNINFLLPANIFIIILSLISLITNYPDDAWTGGNALGFMGFAAHQNTLAMMLLFTMPALFINENKTKLLLIILLIMNLVLLILTYSRASLISVFIAAIIIYKYKMKAAVTLAVTFILMLIIYLTSSEISHAVDKVIEKNSGSILANRTILWGPSYEAAKHGGIFGLGYGVSDPEIITSWGIYKEGRFVRETGNSILALIEETGIIGLALMAYLFYSFFRITKYSIVITAFLTGFFIHSQFEGWITGVSNFPLVFLFTLVMQNAKPEGLA